MTPKEKAVFSIQDTYERILEYIHMCEIETLGCLKASNNTDVETLYKYARESIESICKKALEWIEHSEKAK